MKIDQKEVEYTARLSMLSFDDAEMEQLAEEMGSVLEYAIKINELDTEGVAPMTHVLDNVNAMREDETGETLDIKKVLLNAPDSEGRLIKVPKIL
jgi:aspartyl-tRNA(Asn)/glutamyl-tRNA(Gln) amidotransferase subunit C